MYTWMDGLQHIAGRHHIAVSAYTNCGHWSFVKKLKINVSYITPYCAHETHSSPHVHLYGTVRYVTIFTYWALHTTAIELSPFCKLIQPRCTLILPLGRMPTVDDTQRSVF